MRTSAKATTLRKRHVIGLGPSGSFREETDGSANGSGALSQLSKNNKLSISLVNSRYPRERRLWNDAQLIQIHSKHVSGLSAHSTPCSIHCHRGQELGKEHSAKWAEEKSCVHRLLHLASKGLAVGDIYFPSLSALLRPSLASILSILANDGLSLHRFGATAL